MEREVVVVVGRGSRRLVDKVSGGRVAVSYFRDGHYRVPIM